MSNRANKLLVDLLVYCDCTE